MMEITADKKWLIGKVKQNRATHREAFEDAVEGYRRHQQEILEQKIADLLRGRVSDLRISMSAPRDHTRDYDRVIGMLENHQGETFVLPEPDYAAYVDDDWDWKRQWALSNSGYASAGTRSYYSEYTDA